MYILDSGQGRWLLFDDSQDWGEPRGFHVPEEIGCFLKENQLINTDLNEDLADPLVLIDAEGHWSLSTSSLMGRVINGTLSSVDIEVLKMLEAHWNEFR